MMFAFNSNKIGSWSCFSLTYENNDDSTLYVTTIPPSLESIFVYQTSFASSLFSLRWSVLLIDNLPQESTTTLALAGW